jgi:hypothetical protein
VSKTTKILRQSEAGLQDRGDVIIKLKPGVKGTDIFVDKDRPEYCQAYSCSFPENESESI